ncbi:MAG: indole-3-glycerol phosphate synthase TrpC [Chloroflexota bacterium]
MLGTILSHKRQEVTERKRETGTLALRGRAHDLPPTRGFAAALRRPSVAVIAEIKRASPSRGLIAPDLDPSSQAGLYQQGGAAAISVLTDRRFFAGCLADLSRAREAVSLPALRKDFVIDEYQLYEARLAAADAVLLIVAALADDQLRDLLAVATEIGLDCLVETHEEEEVGRALACGARVIGVNNRDLRTFAVDLATTERLAPGVPEDCTLVAESGIGSRADVERLAAAGVDAVLVGETLVKARDVALTLGGLASVPRLGRQSPGARVQC